MYRCNDTHVTVCYWLALACCPFEFLPISMCYAYFICVSR